MRAVEASRVRSLMSIEPRRDLRTAFMRPRAIGEYPRLQWTNAHQGNGVAGEGRLPRTMWYLLQYRGTAGRKEI